METGILRRDEKKKVMEAAVPVGVIAALIPSTNPTSTVIFKAMIALKTANSIIFSPHPSAAQCIQATVDVIRQALKKFGAPENAVNYLEYASLEATQELMDDRDTKMILATGGKAMVKAAYSSETPAIGVGPGNVPCYIEKTANIPLTVERIIGSKTFDNGVICASEQSVIVDEAIAEAVKEGFIKQGSYFITGEDADKFGRLMIQGNGLMNPAMVGKDAQTLGKIAEVDIPENVKVIIHEETQVGRDYSYSTEKLCPVLAFYSLLVCF
ncbi:aldehyde dehydrogenase family protein [Streptococcus sp. 121]|uniref:aldehyde dehydrogenase family protein n=1 Tax=Streptococcus sp. 121 TaxID=2797637 RepID=UPI0018F0E401|nr:aldehyde dehydrogenase family protein [Streptococcus sp. 121]MBJ6744938.1 aldehyde dehydrogenase family protein [Streptococcus sp. 121]